MDFRFLACVDDFNRDYCANFIYVETSMTWYKNLYKMYVAAHKWLGTEENQILKTCERNKGNKGVRHEWRFLKQHIVFSKALV